MVTDAVPEPPGVDNPISSAAQDRLKRAPVATGFARQVRALDASEGIVVAVLGRWGHGKSSFLNLMREQFAEDPALVVVDFNPWMFSGTQQLVDFFFTEIASGLQVQDKDRFGTAVTVLREYGDVLSPLGVIPVFGSWWDRTFKAGRSFAEWMARRREKNVGTLHDRVASALRDLDAPVVVVIDDIDRLTTPEIRDIFRLVRLTASFPNLIYLLAFDRERVEAALNEDGVPGRAYLEKIVQLGFDLPAIPSVVLREQVFAEFDRLVSSISDLRFDRDRWADVYIEVIGPLIGSLRDVTRITLSARPVIAELGGDIEVVDLLAVESVRVLRPDLFAGIQSLRGTLASAHFPTRTDPEAQAKVGEFLELAGHDAEVVRGLIKRVFPAGEHLIGGSQHHLSVLGHWRRAHRLAHPDFLGLYLDRVAPDGLDAFRSAERAYSLLSDQDALDEYLGSLAPSTLRSAIAALEDYEGEYPADGVSHGVTALLNHVADIPDEPGGVFDFGRDITVSRVALRMLSSINDEGERETSIRIALEGLESLSSKYELILLVGHVDHAGHKLITETAASELEQAFVQEVESVRPPKTDREWALLSAYSFAVSRGAALDPARWDDAEVVRALLVSGQSQRRSRAIDSRHVGRRAVLAWDALVTVFGSEDRIAHAVGTLRAADGNSELVELAERYLGGWRPERF